MVPDVREYGGVRYITLLPHAVLSCYQPVMTGYQNILILFGTLRFLAFFICGLYTLAPAPSPSPSKSSISCGYGGLVTNLITALDGRHAG